MMKKLSELGISPAPWKNPNWENNSFIFDSNNLEVAIVSGDCKDEANANAFLIAAAPELFDMLQSLVEYIDRECIPCGETACELLAAAHNVLSKAAGEEVGDGK